MLQRTQVRQVTPIFEKFIQKFPEPRPVSEKDLEELLFPLGLKHRIKRVANLMTKLASIREVPNTMEDLLKLPGVGVYIASAVLCFGFGQDVPVVDPNVVRVLSRVMGFRSAKKRPHTDPKIWEFAARIVPKQMGRAFNEALIDFGALICKPKPICKECPMPDICYYFKNYDASLTFM